MTTTRIIGIDPGASGGIAVLTITEGRVSLSDAMPLPPTERDIFAALRVAAYCSTLDASERPGSIVIEKVGAMPGQGVTSMFKFGQSYGMLRGFAIALGVPLHEYTPQTWQKALGLNRKFDSRKDRKNAHKARAQELFPHLTITHAIADALLIAEAHRRLTTPTLANT